MRPPVWHPPIELSAAEQAIERRIRRAKLFVWLRQWRQEVQGPSAGWTVPPVAESLATAQQVVAQDVRVDETGRPLLWDGVAKDRRISVGDGEMRHGRK